MSLEIASIARRLAPRLRAVAVLSVVVLSSYSGHRASAQSARSVVVTHKAADVPTAVDAGPAPASERLSLTLTLAPTAAQSAALSQLLDSITTPTSPSYHHWLTPQQFASSYGASPDQIAAATAWLQSQGLSVDAVSPAGRRISVSGFTAQVESAFGTAIHSFQANGALYHANVALPSLPVEVAPVFAAIDGLDNLPGGGATLSLSSLAPVVDANASAVLPIDARGLTVAPSPAQIAGLEALFQQAAAQGITTMVYTDFGASAFGASASSVGFPEVTAITVPGSQASTATAIAARPSWQIAVGLPADGLRDVPDLTASSLSDFSQTIASIATQSGGRLGNINAVLYQLAVTPGVYTQPDNAATGTWESATGLGLVDTAKLAQAFPRLGTGTSNLSISSTSTAPTHGQSFTLTIADTSTNGGSLPTGTITLTSPQAGFTPSTISLVNGSVTTPPYLLPGGTYTITAAYSGDSNYAAQTASITINVQPEAAVFTISAPATASLGSTITATVTLKSASGLGTPNVTVTVVPSGINGAATTSQAITGTGGTATGTFAFTTTQAGTVSLQASCVSNDQSFTCYTPQTSTTTVPQATPQVVLTMTPSSPTAGVPVVLASTVSGVSGITPSGSVQFFDGMTALGSGSAPSASYTTTLAPGVSHSLTAVYQGDSNYVTGTSNIIKANVATASSSTTVSASASTATFGQSITLNITVSPGTVVNGTQPTGTLTFTGAGTTTTAPVSGGSANVTLNNLPVGTYTVGTSYSGDVNYSSSVGNTVSFTITPASATLTTAISSSSFTTGSTSTLTVTITLPGTATLPTGSTFLATIVGVTGAAYSGTFTVNAGGNTGTGSVTIPAPIAGAYSLQVTCGASTSFTCAPSTLSISSTATSAGSATGSTVTTAALAISPTTPAVGQAITFTATVSAAASAIAANPITGTVSFYDGTTLIGTGTISTVAGVATATATLTLAGTSTTTAHSLTAAYSGDKNYAASTSTALSVTLAAAAASIALSSNVTTTIAGSSIVLTATVSGPTNISPAPTGTVTFYIAGTSPALIGVATLGSAGNGLSVAVFSTSNLPDGNVTIYASYSGDSNYSAGISNSITLGLSDYTLSFVPNTMTLTAGQIGTTTVVVALIDKFPGTIVLGCTPPPNLEITCSFNPEVLTGAGTSTLTVTTTAAKTGALRGPKGAEFGIVGGISLAGVLCWLLPTRRRRMPALLLWLLALGLTMNMGCSADNFSVSGNLDAGTPFGTTLLTINTAGTNGSQTVRHNYNYQVTVQ